MTFDDTTLATALARFSRYIEDPAMDFGPGLAQLAAAVRYAVPSYCGLSITLVADGIPVTITAPEPTAGDAAGAEPRADAAASLVVPLSAVSHTTAGELELFASAAGAFVDLAADLAHATATELVTFALDTRLSRSVAWPVGVDGFSVIHQAVGVLVGSGHTPEQARARIAHLAAGDGHHLAAAAHRIVHGGER